MAKFYADESVPKLLVQLLREGGHIVEHAAENPQQTKGRKHALLRTTLDRGTLVLTLDQNTQRWIVEKNVPILGVVSLQLAGMNHIEQVEPAIQAIQEQGHCLRNFVTTIYADCIEMYPSHHLLREYPFSDQPCITITPDMMPTIKGAQVTVEFIVEQIANGLTSTELCAAYPLLTDKGVNAALLYHRNQLIQENGYPCPCCGYLVFKEPPGSFDICRVCFWEDDARCLDPLLLSGGANKVSLLQGQQNYLAFGACEEQMKPHARPPLPDERRTEGWRPIDPEIDSIDKMLIDTIRKEMVLKDRPYLTSISLSFLKDRFSVYYWSPTYWRRVMRPRQDSSLQQPSPSNEEKIESYVHHL